MDTTYSNKRHGHAIATPEEIKSAVEHGALELEVNPAKPCRWRRYKPSYQALVEGNHLFDGVQRWCLQLNTCLPEPPKRGDDQVIVHALPEDVFAARYPGGLDQFAEENNLHRLSHPYHDYAIMKDADDPHFPVKVFRLSYSDDQTGSKRVRRWFNPKPASWSGAFLGNNRPIVYMVNSQTGKRPSFTHLRLSELLKEYPAGPQNESADLLEDAHWLREKAFGRYPKHDPAHIPQEQPATS